MSRPRRIQQSTRTAALRTMLEARRRDLSGDVSDKMRDVRSRSSGDRDGVDPQEQDGDIQDDLELALIQMKAETLRRVENALRRLDDGRYGDCAECGKEIPSERLQALPFAIRCRPCEEVREARRNRSQPPVERAYAQAGRDTFE